MIQKKQCKPFIELTDEQKRKMMVINIENLLVGKYGFLSEKHLEMNEKIRKQQNKLGIGGLLFDIDAKNDFFYLRAQVLTNNIRDVYKKMERGTEIHQKTSSLIEFLGWEAPLLAEGAATGLAYWRKRGSDRKVGIDGFVEEDSLGITLISDSGYMGEKEMDKEQQIRTIETLEQKATLDEKKQLQQLKMKVMFNTQRKNMDDLIKLRTSIVYRESQKVKISYCNYVSSHLKEWEKEMTLWCRKEKVYDSIMVGLNQSKKIKINTRTGEVQ